MKIFRLFVALTLVCFVLSPMAQAVVPAPDGGYPGFNTAEGDAALFNLTTGINNTAVGASALRDDTTGGYNVGIGTLALASNTTGFQNTAVGTEALTNNTANFNSAIGFRVGYMNTTGALLAIAKRVLSPVVASTFSIALCAGVTFNDSATPAELRTLPDQPLDPAPPHGVFEDCFKSLANSSSLRSRASISARSSAVGIGILAMFTFIAAGVWPVSASILSTAIPVPIADIWRITPAVTHYQRPLGRLGRTTITQTSSIPILCMASCSELIRKLLPR